MPESSGASFSQGQVEHVVVHGRARGESGEQLSCLMCHVVLANVSPQPGSALPGHPTLTPREAASRGGTHPQLPALLAHQLAVLDEVHGALVHGSIRLVPQPVLVALHGGVGRGTGHEVAAAPVGLVLQSTVTTPWSLAPDLTQCSHKEPGASTSHAIPA